MFGAFKKERTKVVAGILSRLESHVVVVTQAALAQLRHKVGDPNSASETAPSEQAAREVAASGMQELVPGAPLSNLGQLDLSGTPMGLLESLDHIVMKAEQVQGSKAELTSEAQQLIDDHYKNIALVRRAIASGKTVVASGTSDEMVGFLNTLSEACKTLGGTAQRLSAIAK